MKKVLVLFVVLVMALLAFTSCQYLPDGVKDAIDGIFGNKGEHDHEFVLEKSLGAATCTKAEEGVFRCSCGAREKRVVTEALGHDYTTASVVKPACNKAGSTRYICTRCSKMISETIPATGHDIGEFEELSRLIYCRNSGCSYAYLPEGEGKYKEVIVYKFSDSDLDEFDRIFNELDEIITAAPAYDSTLHTYEEGSETHERYLVMEAKYEELYDVLEYVTSQYQIAQVEYHVDMGDAQNKEDFDYISKIRTDLVSRFYSFSQAIYDSMYRDYYYFGMTEEEIKAFIFESDAVSNPEYKALVDRNSEIEIEFNEIPDPSLSDKVPQLYAEFVENNKKIAELMGYDNYLEYAYSNVYDRDYSYQDVKAIADYVKEYIAPLYNNIFSRWNRITANLTQSDAAYIAYVTYVTDSFFANAKSNKQLNDYIDKMSFTSNPDKQISFSDELNNLMGDGNLFRGQYGGAYVTTLYGIDIPIAYFGNSSYSSSFTVAHEFGHYMNEIYSGGVYSQSFDLLEMHSQGNELLYLAYLNSRDDVMNDIEFEMVQTYQMISMLDTIMNALAVDTFEQAIYTNSYEGKNADVIMADGKITADEYDLLYTSIISDFGGESYMTDTYWRYVTVLAPCYYVSYSVSALSVLQLYPMANENFDAAKDAYLKLFTYVDTYESEDDYITTVEVLEYAGLYSFTDEELYVYIANNIE